MDKRFLHDYKKSMHQYYKKHLTIIKNLFLKFIIKFNF